MLVLAASVCGCATPKMYDGPYDPLSDVPSSFLAQYPIGSQQRKIADLQKTFDGGKKELIALYHEALTKHHLVSGQVDVAIALQPDGSVEAVGLIGSELADPEFERALMFKVGHLDFGPASGEGLYVFWYPIRFVIQ